MAGCRKIYSMCFRALKDNTNFQLNEDMIDLDRTSLVNNQNNYMEKEHYFLVGQIWQDSSILPARVANHRTGFVLSFPRETLA